MPRKAKRSSSHSKKRGKSKKRSSSHTKKRRTKHIKAVGSRAEVFHGNAKHTSGGLTKAHLMKNKRGEIVSRKKHASGKVLYKKYESVLKKWQYTSKKKA